MDPQPTNTSNCKVAVVGNVDSGKSTLVGVLTKATSDDGKGSARKLVFNYTHEIQSGRTSSVCYEIMGFDGEGKQYTPERLDLNRARYWDEVVKHSQTLVTFLDLCGHLKYLKTTITGLCGLGADYAMIIIGSNMGISQITNVHMALCLIMKIPFFIVLTKIDMSANKMYEQTCDKLKQILRSPAVKRIPVFIRHGTQKNEVVRQAELMIGNKGCPIFCVSSVKLDGIEELRWFLGKLKPRGNLEKNLGSSEGLFQFSIMETYMVKGIGLVVSGLVKSGRIEVEQQCFLGPDKNKAYKIVTIKSIQIQRKQSKSTQAGDLACLNIKVVKANQKIARNDLHRGTMLFDIKSKPQPSWQFQAEVQVLKHHTTMVPGYESVMHLGLIQQTVRLKHILNSEQQLMRSQDKKLVRLRFVYSPEHVKEKDRFLLREGMVRAIGIVTRVFTEQELQIEESLARKQKKQQPKKQPEPPKKLPEPPKPKMI